MIVVLLKLKILINVVKESIAENVRVYGLQVTNYCKLQNSNEKLLTLAKVT